MKKVYIVIAVYLLVGVLLVGYYRYTSVTDIVPYISIAQKYIDGNFFDAVNGVWGVLISWLLIPFLLFGLEPFLAFKIMNLIIGAFAIIGLYRLSKVFKLSFFSENILLLVSVILFLNFSLIVTTPDLLVMTVLLYYLYYIFDKQYLNNYKKALIVGLLGGVGYLAKHYVFCFIAVHLVIMHILHYLANKHQTESIKKTTISLILSVSVFTLISGIWIGTLSNKYGYLNFGTSVKYNRAWMAPGSKGHAPEYIGFTKPPNTTASSMWEDLTYYVDQMPNHDWSPFDSLDSLKYQIFLVFKNVNSTIIMYNELTFLLWPTILLCSLVYLFTQKSKYKDILLDPVWLSLWVIFIYSSGYLLILTSDRYLWIVAMLFLLLSLFFYDRLVGVFNKYELDFRQTRMARLFIISVIMCAFLIFPARRFVINKYRDKSLYDIAQVFKHQGINGKIASDKYWSDTSVLAFHSDLKYYGIPATSVSLEKNMESLIDNNIDYFIIWGADDRGWSEEFVDKILDDKNYNYKLYKIR